MAMSLTRFLPHTTHDTEEANMTTELTWRDFPNGDLYLDVAGNRMTIRESAGGYALRVNSEVVEVCATVEEAAHKGYAMATSMTPDMRDRQRRDLIENALSLYRGRCGHQWVGATEGYYGCPICGDADGTHHLRAIEPIAMQPDDYGSGTWQRLAENQVELNRAHGMV